MFKQKLWSNFRLQINRWIIFKPQTKQFIVAGDQHGITNGTIFNQKIMKEIIYWTRYFFSAPDIPIFNFDFWHKRNYQFDAFRKWKKAKMAFHWGHFKKGRWIFWIIFTLNWMIYSNHNHAVINFFFNFEAMHFQSRLIARCLPCIQKIEKMSFIVISSDVQQILFTFISHTCLASFIHSWNTRRNGERKWKWKY